MSKKCYVIKNTEYTLLDKKYSIYNKIMICPNSSSIKEGVKIYTPHFESITKIR